MRFRYIFQIMGVINYGKNIKAAGRTAGIVFKYAC